MHLNSGYRKDAEQLGRRFRSVFGEFDAVVSPSSSCVGTVRGEWGMTNVFELSELLVQKLGVENVGARFPAKVAYHPTCHSLRVTRVGDAPLRLLRNVRGLELVEHADAERVLRLRRDVRAQERRHVERHARRQVRCARGVRSRVVHGARQLVPAAHRRRALASTFADRRHPSRRDPRRDVTTLSGSSSDRAREHTAAVEPPARDRDDSGEARTRRRRAAGLGGAARRRQGDQGGRARESRPLPGRVRERSRGGRRAGALGSRRSRGERDRGPRSHGLTVRPRWSRSSR